MARALGMNPRKLPRLRPSPQARGPHGARVRRGVEERWKLPVGEFIEECYRKRFGGDTRDRHARGKEQQSRKPSATNLEMNGPERVRDPAYQLSDLACYLVNLADDQQWLVHGSIDPEVPPQVREELLRRTINMDRGLLQRERLDPGCAIA